MYENIFNKKVRWVGEIVNEDLNSKSNVNGFLFCRFFIKCICNKFQYYFIWIQNKVKMFLSIFFREKKIIYV